MLLLFFNNYENLEKFLEKELKKVDECPEDMCFKACSEEKSVYLLSNFDPDIYVMYRVWNEYHGVSIFPCNAYDGLGFIVGERVDNIIRTRYDKLMNYAMYLIKNYEVVFLAVLSLPLEPEKSIYTIAPENTVVMFYIRNCNSEFINKLTRSSFIKRFIFNVMLQDYVHSILNPYIPCMMYKMPNRDDLKKVCKEMYNVVGENDILCIIAISR